MVLCAAYVEVLLRWSDSEAFLLNMTHFTRPPVHPRVGEVVGDFTSLLFLEVRRGGAEGFAAGARALQEQLREHLEHESVSGVEVLRGWAREGLGDPHLRGNFLRQHGA